MSIVSVRALSRVMAEAHVPSQPSVMISISDPGLPAPRLHPEYYDVLSLAFDGCPEFAGERVTPHAFDEASAEALAAFVARWVAHPVRMHCIVHCELGISRSVTVAHHVGVASGLIEPRTPTPSGLNPRIGRMLSSAIARCPVMRAA
jgi:predicted protein tyrosine phosphatase